MSGVGDLRVAVVAEHASARWGGEAILPLHYFRHLRARGVEAWLVVHERARGELDGILTPADRARVEYVPETAVQRVVSRVGRKFPPSVNYFVFQLVVRLLTQLRARRVARRLVAERGVNVVHQPIPVSPKEFSLFHSVGAPVVIGPMNGGMKYPRAFRRRQSRIVRAFVRGARWVSQALNRLIPGKLRAEVLLVANERTRAALPAGVRGRVLTLVENGVDLALWQANPARPIELGRPARFVFVGRLIDWKGVDLLLEAFAHVVRGCDARLDVIGQGGKRAQLEELSAKLGLENVVRFRGWLPQEQCAQELKSATALVLPSLFECGGAVVLEAMACGLPVVAANWGGPADYLDSSCGILVEPVSRIGFIDGLAEAMRELAANPEFGRRLGDAGRRKVVREFDWQRKVDRILEVYRLAVRGGDDAAVSLSGHNRDVAAAAPAAAAVGTPAVNAAVSGANVGVSA